MPDAMTAPSRTAMVAAVCRGLHRMTDRAPWVVDDPLALPLAGPGWTEIGAALGSALGDTELAQVRAGFAVRSRYVEDRLLAGRFGQYVLLGAGLDTFAWRRPDLLGPLRVFELDHPATQAWKQDRATTVALPTHPDHVFAPVDLERESPIDGLTRCGFDPSRPACLSWLGVVQYLTPEAIRATLAAVAGCAPGTEIVFTYVVTDPYLDDVGVTCRERMSAVAASSGEPWRTLLGPDEVEALVDAVPGLSVSDHVDRDALHERYFAGRPDGLTPYTVMRCVTATVS